MKILVARFWNDEPSDFAVEYREVIGLRRLSTHQWEVRHKFGRTEPKQIAELVVVADHEEFEMVEEGEKCFVFDSTSEAYDACQTREDIKNGDMLVIPSEKVVGLAWTWPVAVTAEFGAFHRPIKGDLGGLIVDAKWTKEQVDAAVRFAKKHDWLVAEFFLQEV